MKKLVCLIICLCFAVIVFSSCADESDSADSTVSNSGSGETSVVSQDGTDSLESEKEYEDSSFINSHSEVVIVTSTPDGTVKYIDREVVITTSLFYDPDNFNGEGPFEFNGVAITAMDALFSCDTEEDLSNWVNIMGDYYAYKITLDPSWHVLDAIDVMLQSENVIYADPNYFSGGN